MAQPSNAIGVDEVTPIGWTRNAVIVLALCTAAWAFDVYESTAFALATPSIINEFHIDRTTIGALPLIQRWVGLIGSVAGVALADVYGRKAMMALMILGYSIFSGITGLTSTWPQLFGATTLTKIPLSMTSVTGIMATESVPTKWRGFGQGIYVSGYPMGFFLCSLISIYVIPHFGWRAMYFVGILPAFLVFLVMRTVKESPRFAAVRAEKKRTGQKQGISMLTVVKRYPRETVLAIWLNFAFLFPWTGWSTWFSTYLNVDMKLGLQTSSTYAAIWMFLAIWAYWLCGFICDKIGRKKGVSLFTIPGGIFLLLYGSVTDQAGIFIIGTLLNFCIIGPFGAGNNYYYELFPTEARASAVAAVAILGFIASTGALVVAAMPTLGDGFRVLGIVELLIAPTFIFFTKETIGKELINRIGERAGDDVPAEAGAPQLVEGE